LRKLHKGRRNNKPIILTCTQEAGHPTFMLLLN